MMVALTIGVGLVVFGLFWSTREEPWSHPSRLEPARPMRNRGDDECLAMWNPPEGGI